MRTAISFVEPYATPRSARFASRQILPWCTEWKRLSFSTGIQLSGDIDILTGRCVSFAPTSTRTTRTRPATRNVSAQAFPLSRYSSGAGACPEETLCGRVSVTVREGFRPVSHSKRDMVPQIREFRERVVPRVRRRCRVHSVDRNYAARVRCDQEKRERACTRVSPGRPSPESQNDVSVICNSILYFQWPPFTALEQ